jgi:hypothetical protein
MAAVFFLAIALPPNIKERAGRPTLSFYYHIPNNTVSQIARLCKHYFAQKGFIAKKRHFSAKAHPVYSSQR